MEKFTFLSAVEKQELEHKLSNKAYLEEIEVMTERISSFISFSYPFNLVRLGNNQEKENLISCFNTFDYFQLKIALHLFKSDYEVIEAVPKNSFYWDSIEHKNKNYGYEEMFSLLNEMASYIEKELFERFQVPVRENVKGEVKIKKI